ncbi:hypothetical protein MRX96_041800 [Rhipicephalus microplus]
MNFVDEADKVSTAIADAIEAPSASSIEEYVAGAPLKAEMMKKKQEEVARKQKEAEESNKQDEKAQQLKEAQEQEENRKEEASKREEEEKRQNELDAKKLDEDEHQRRRKDEWREDEEARWRPEKQKKEEKDAHRRRRRPRDEEQYAQRWFEERRRYEKVKSRRLKQERRWLEEDDSLEQLDQESELLEEQEATAKDDMSESGKAEALSPMTKHIVKVISKLDKCRINTERPSTMEVSTETGNDLFYRRPEQGPMRNEETQTGPVKQPVASYLIKRPRSETRLQRLLSFFGLASPDEPEQEVIEYNFFDPTAISSRYDDQQPNLVHDKGPYPEQKSANETAWRGEKKECTEYRDPEEKPDKLNVREDDTSKQKKKYRGDKKSSKSALHPDVHKDRAPASTKTVKIHVNQTDKQNVSATGGTGTGSKRARCGLY